MTRPTSLERAEFDDYGLSAFTFRCQADAGHLDDLRTQRSHTVDDA